MASLRCIVELGTLGRQFVEDQAFVGAGLLELGLELRTAVNPDGQHGKPISSSTLSRNRLAAWAEALPTAWAAAAYLATGR